MATSLALGLIMFSHGTYASTSLLRLALPVREIQLDPHRYEDLYSMVVVNQIYARLFRYTPDGEIRSDLVKKWKASPDKTVYTFELRESTFSDGTPLTAKHVENSLKRIFHVKAAIASDLMIIKGAKTAIATGNTSNLKISAQSTQVLQIVTEQPTSLLFYLLAVPDCGILKLNSPNDVPSFGPTSPFSGVYRVSTKSTDKIVLEKWRSSDFDSQRPPQSAEIRLMDQIEPELAVSGDLTDTSSFMTFDEEKSRFADHPNCRAVPSEASNERFIIFNPKKISQDVRTWLAAQIQPGDLVRRLNDRSIQPAFGFIPNCLPGHLSEQYVRPKTELKIKKPMTILITYAANLPYADKFKDFLREAWKHPKINIEFESLPVSQALKMLFAKEGMVIIGAKGLDYPEGYSVLGYFRSGIDANYYHIESKTVDSMLDRAAAELDGAKRAEIYKQIQVEVLKSATVVPLAFGSFKKYFWHRRVAVVPPHPIGAHFIPFEMLELAAP